MKAFTDLEQSRRLSEILSLESADMIYPSNFGFPFVWIEKPKKDKNSTPCWSLAALLSILKSRAELVTTEGSSASGCWSCELIFPFLEQYAGFTEADNLVDACYEMILKLHRNKLL